VKRDPPNPFGTRQARRAMRQRSSAQQERRFARRGRAEIARLGTRDAACFAGATSPSRDQPRPASATNVNPRPADARTRARGRHPMTQDEDALPLTRSPVHQRPFRDAVDSEGKLRVNHWEVLCIRTLIKSRYRISLQNCAEWK